METILEQVSTPGTNTNTARGTHSGEVQLVNIQLFNLSKIVGTSIFNRYPIPVYLRYAGFPDIHFPYAILDPQGPIGVIGLEAIEFNLCNVEKDEKIYAGSFVRKFETQSKPPIANSTTLDRESQLVKINRVPVDNTHVEHYDLWFEFKDDHAVTQYAMVDPVLQANQRG